MHLKHSFWCLRYWCFKSRWSRMCQGLSFPFLVKVLLCPMAAALILGTDDCCLQDNYNTFLYALSFHIKQRISVTNFAERETAHPPTLLLAELSAICELAIHFVSPTTVLACGRRPTSFTVIIRCRDDFRTLTASSCGTLRKLRPLTSKIWSPTCGEGRAYRGMVGGTEQGGKGGPCCHVAQVQRWKVRGLR